MIRALTLDLDDTLWAIVPVMLRAEQALDEWLGRHCPPVAQRYPIEAMRTLRAQVALDHPHLAHDFTAQRRLALHTAFATCGEDIAHVEPAFEAFYAARNRVELFPEVEDALARIAARIPIAALTNGNADLQRIGIAHHFRAQLSAREHGAGKPDPGIFHAACARLGCAPGAVLHVGDDPALDVHGALGAGLRAGWLNRHGAEWSDSPTPELILPDLAQLADWVEAQTPR